MALRTLGPAAGLAALTLTASNILMQLEGGGLPEDRRLFLERQFNNLTVVDADESNRWTRYRMKIRPRLTNQIGHA